MTPTPRFDAGALPGFLQAPDPYDHSLPGDERMTQHAPTDICLWVAKHKVSDCGYPRHPGWTWDPHTKRWRLNPPRSKPEDLTGVPAALAAPEPAPPWEVQR